MIRLCLPIGSAHGWGVLGKAMVRELSAMTQVQLIGQPFNLDTAGDALDFELCRSVLPPGLQPGDTPPGGRFDGPVLQAIRGTSCEPYRADVRGTFNVGYTFFEHDLLVAPHAEKAAANFDCLAAGCTWCAQQLRECGYRNVQVVLQGVDPRVFFPMDNAREYFRDRFVIFSGGKFEYRKGQDLVVRAFAALRQRHRDVLLVNAWFNFLDASVHTMSASRLVRMVPRQENWTAFTNRFLSENGVDPADAVTLGPYTNPLIARVYRNSDVGLFPNRCEGGTNLVLCEYMACGKPAIAAFNSGQMDVLSDDNSLPIRSHAPLPIHFKGIAVARWQEPNLDETIERLEWAYNHRGELAAIGQRAAADMSKLTWRKTAEQFLGLLTQQPAASAEVVKSTPNSLS